MFSSTPINLGSLAGGTADLSCAADRSDPQPYLVVQRIERYVARLFVNRNDAMHDILLFLSLITSSCRYCSRG